MKCIAVNKAGRVNPTGDGKFFVSQAFPSAFDEKITDPFLMCDEFGPVESKGLAKDPDDFEVGWHPHRGFDILTYIIKGVGRHADSLGNRGTFKSPGMQWMSVGSGVMHAEGGGTPKGELQHGFQIWVNVPSAKKMEPPRYGTENPENLPVVQPAPGVSARLMAGAVGPKSGPFKTVANVQMVDFFEIAPNTRFEHPVPKGMNTCLVYVYRGELTIGGKKVPAQHVARMDATDDKRGVEVVAGSSGGAAIFFSGTRLGEPIVWRGPFVMSTQEQMRDTILEYQRGDFPPVKAGWDYTSWADTPDHIKTQSH